MRAPPAIDPDELPAPLPRTRPWLPGEFMIVDGARVVYTINKRCGEMLVRLPGGVTTTVEELRALGREVVMPSAVRTRDIW